MTTHRLNDSSIADEPAWLILAIETTVPVLAFDGPVPERDSSHHYDPARWTYDDSANIAPHSLATQDRAGVLVRPMLNDTGHTLASFGRVLGPKHGRPRR